jgi:hypothetical protein
MRATGTETTDEGRDYQPAPTGSTDELEEPSTTGSGASFWDESQVLAVIRHACATGRSLEEFFTRKWKQALFQGK